MYRGPVTEELRRAFIEYEKQHGGIGPDEYDEICFESMTYEEMMGYLKEALEKKCCIVDVIE